jgi:xylulokinase
MLLLGIDIGTTRCKAIVFDPHGKIIGSDSKEYGIITDNSGKAEQDAELIWRITCTVIKSAVRNISKHNIKALSISVQGDAIIPVDKKFNAMHNAILGIDYRSKENVELCDEVIGNRKLFNITGMRPHPLNSLLKIIWLKKNVPDIYNRAWKITTYEDYIFGKFGVEPVIDYTMASRTMALDLKKHNWSHEILTRFDIRYDLFNQLKPPGTIIGKIKRNVAEDLGLSKDIILVTGGHDQTCAALGAGLITEGTGLISTGTAEVLSTVLQKPILDDNLYNNSYPCYIYLKENMYFTFSLNHVGGLLLEWYKDNFENIKAFKQDQSKRDIYEHLLSRIPDEPSKILFLPHLIGSGTPWCDFYSKGAIIGLKISTTKYDILKAILESLTYELMINMEIMKSAGIVIKNLNAVGGGAKSPLWLQIKSDILNQPINTLRVKEAACLGAAILAGTAIGIYSNIDEGVKMTVSVLKTYYPDKINNNIYQKIYMIYKDVYPSLKLINKRLSF